MDRGREFVRGAAVLVVGVLLAGSAFAWGPATHAYIAWKATGLRQPAVIYGSAAPDVDHLALREPEVRSALRNLTHRHADLLEEGYFALGMATHNSAWGADAMAHGTLDAAEGLLIDGYLMDRAEVLSNETGISLGEAETYLEAAVDLLVCKEVSPGTGGMLMWGALIAGGTGRRQLVNGFSAPLADAVADLSEDEAARMIGGYANLFAMAIFIYGGQVQAPEDYLMVVYPLALSAYLGTDWGSARTNLARAVSLCADCGTALDQAAVIVRDGLVANGY